MRSDTEAALPGYVPSRLAMILPEPIRAAERDLIAAATAGDDGPVMLGAFLRALLEAGWPLLRASISVPTIDPQFRGVSLLWWRGQDVVIAPTAHGASGEDEFANSPVGWLQERGLTSARWRLEGTDDHPDLPVIASLKAAGGTDYVLTLTAFAPDTALRGAAIAFATDRPGGFTEEEREGLASLVPSIALTTAKLVLSHTLREVLDTYLGPATGARVLAGEMRRGQGGIVPAAILLTDLRGFTTLADRDDPLRVVGWLDEHFDALGEPVLRHGGEISKFLGDGFLAVFPIADPLAPSCPSCTAALAAAQEALVRNDALNAARRARNEPVLEADAVLHYGHVVYGNVGTGNRLDFTVIGRAINEASRIERLCEEVGHRLVLSDAFAERCSTRLVPVGEFALRGIGRPQRLWVPG